MATLRMTGDSLLTSISTAAEAATSLVSSIGTGAKMINDFALDARTKQLMRIETSNIGYEQDLKIERSMQIAAAHKKLEDYLSANQHQAQLIQQIHAELNDAIVRAKAKAAA